MPITMIFFPGRMPPRMRPLNGTVYAKYIEMIQSIARGENQKQEDLSIKASFIPGDVINPPCQVR